MKKIIIAFSLLLILGSCSTAKVKDTSKDLYQVLVSSDYGGASFQFYETITEEREFTMLLGDDEIKKYVKPDDIKTSNFILVNLGEKSTSGYGVEIKSVVELADKIIVEIVEKKPDESSMTLQTITNPYCVLKINSKKPIEIK